MNKIIAALSLLTTIVGSSSAFALSFKGTNIPYPSHASVTYTVEFDRKNPTSAHVTLTDHSGTFADKPTTVWLDITAFSPHNMPGFLSPEGRILAQGTTIVTKATAKNEFAGTIDLKGGTIPADWKVDVSAAAYQPGGPSAQRPGLNTTLKKQ